MKYLVVLQAVILCFGLSKGFCSAAWPNEPAGSTQFADCPFSNSMCSPLRGLYPGQVNAFASFPATNQLSPSYALDSYMAAGSSSGNGMWGAENLPYVKEIYVGTWWSTNADFMGMANNSNKMIFINGVENSLLDWMGSPGQPKQILWVQQAHEDNCHVAGYVGGCWNSPTNPDGTGHFNPNVNAAAATVAAGSGWHQLEIYRKASTSNTSRDGIIRIWVDGVLTSNYTNVNQDPGGFSSVIINQSWDGNGTTNNYCTWRDCTKSWHHYWDHLRISFPNCGPAGCAAPAYLIINSTLPGGRTGMPYMSTLTAEGGTKPYTWFRESGNLPNGLTLNQSTGVISGTPTCVGRSDFTIRVTDGSQPALTAKRSYTIITTGTGACTSILNSDAAKQTQEAAFVAKAVRGKVTFSLPVTNSANYRLSVYDLRGNKVYENQSMGQKEISIMTGLKNGVYFAKFYQGQKASTVRFNVMN